jgi:ATP-dependent DNA helicase RecQ
MYRYCSGVACRHRIILNYFGQDTKKENCRACDICLGEVEGVRDALVVAQKILSSVVRQGERFGADYTAGVLIGSREDRIVGNLHDKLSTYGLLKDATRSAVRDWIEQLADQDCLARGDYGVLKVTEKGRRVLKGIDQPLLIAPAVKKAAPKPSVAVDSWEGVDRALFEKLRRLRTRLAREKNVPAYIVFSDATLRELARKRPSNAGALLDVSGIGMKKLEEYGDAVLQVLAGKEE